MAAVFVTEPTLAQYTPQTLNISGGLYQPNGLPVTNASVDFRIEIWDKNATCKLYEETHLAQNLSQTKGGFSLQLGQGSSITNFRDGGNPGSLSWLVFANPGAPATVFAGCGGGVIFAAGDNRMIRVYYDLGGGMTAMTPDVPIESSAYAMVANTLEGKAASEFLQVRDDVGTDLSQSNIETVFSATNYAKLLQLLNNTFAGSYGFNNQRITDVAAPTAGTDAVNRTWVDGHVGDKAADLSGVGAGTNNGHTLVWDAGNNRWTTGVPSAIDASKLPLAGGTMSGPITMGGFDLYNTGHITMGNQRMLTLGRYTSVQEGLLGLGAGDEGRMFYNTDLDAVRVWDGTGYIGFGASGAAGGDLTGSYPNPTIGANAVTNTKIGDDAVQSRHVDQAGIGINRLVISDNTTGANLRFKTCALNQILRWEATGWQCVDVATALPNSGAAAGIYGSSTSVSRIGVNAQGVVTFAADVAINFPVVSVNGKTGVVVLNGADLGLGTASLEDVGNGANEVPMTDGTGKLNPSVIPTLGIGDISGAITQIVAGSGLTGGGTQGVVTLAVDLAQVDAYKIRGRDVAAAAPAASDVLMWNAGTSVWEPTTIPAAPVYTFTGTNGALVSGTAFNKTISIDTGVTAGQIVQVAAGDRLPVIDGSNLTQISNLRNVNVSTTVPTSNQVLQYNGSAWEAATLTDNAGVTYVATTSDLTGGPISATGTLGVNTGTGANQILKLNGSSQIPAVDGSLLTNVSAYSIRGVNVSTTAPTLNQVLQYNGSGWEAATLTDNAGVTLVTAGTGLLGGVINSTGTISVDVGTGANQIVQLDGSSRLPAVNGSQLTNVNAVQIQTRDVASAAPADNQVLTWNNSASRWEPRTPGAGADNLGSHIAAQNIQLNGFWLSGDGGNEGVFVAGAGNVGVGTNTPNANAILDINGLASMSALLVPRDSTGNRPTGVAGMIRYNTTTAKMEVYENGNWADVVQTPDGGILTLTGENGALVSGSATVKTISIDTGVTTGQIVQVAAGNRLPVIDGSNLTQISNLRNVNVSTTAPTLNQVLQYNGSAWEAATLTDNAGVTLVTAGTGLLGGVINSTGTLNVDVGTSANQIVQLDGSSRLPAVNGSLLTNVNAVKLQTYDVHTAAPADNQVLTWNNSASRWEARSPGAGADNLGSHTAAQNIQLNGFWLSGDGGNEGVFVASAGNVGVGTGTPNANSILDINGLGAMSALVVPRDTQANRPTGVNGMIRYNTNSAKMEVFENGGWSDVVQSADGVGVSYVATTSDLTGGPISATGTLGINTGTGANQILKLNGSSQIPAVDGSLLTNVNAASIRGVNVSTTAPVGNQVLQYNGSAWAPATLPAANDVAAGTAILLTGPSTMRTISVDVGIGANQIPQLNGSGYLGIGTASVTAGAVADFYGASNLDSAVVLPRATTANRPGGVNGMIRYNTSLAKFEVYENGNWYSMATGSTGDNLGNHIATQALQLNGQWLSNDGGAEGIRIDNSGNVGIGTTNPSALLNVYSVATNDIVQESGNAAYFLQKANNGSTGYTQQAIGGTPYFVQTKVGAGWASVGNNSTIGAWDTTAWDGSSFLEISKIYSQIDGNISTGNAPSRLVFSTSSGAALSERMRIDKNGNVGIGTASPSQALHTVGNFELEDNNPKIVLDDNNGNDVYLQNVNGDLRFSRNDDTTINMLIEQLGRVGIGTSTPNAAAVLDVNGTGNLSAMIVPRATTAERPVTATNGMIRYNTNLAKFEVYEGGAWTSIATGSPTSSQWTTIAGNELIYNSAAFVGVGSGLDPTAEFHVADTGSTTARLRISNSTTGHTTADGLEAGVFNDDAWLYNMEGGALDLGTSGLTRVSIRPNGNLGIGTNNPSSKFQLYESANVDLVTNLTNVASGYGSYLNLQAASNYTGLSFDGSSRNWYIGQEATPDLRVQDFTSSLTPIFIKGGTGQIGINSTSPTAGTVLDIVGTGTISSMIIPRDTTANRPTGVNGMIRYNTNLAAFEVYANNNWATLATGTGGSSQWTTVAGNEIHYSTANVGIGTSDPWAKLQVHDDTFVDIAISNGTASTHSFPSLTLEAHQNSYSGHPRIILLNTQGTYAAPTATTSGMKLGEIDFLGRGTSGSIYAANIHAVAEATFADGDAPAALVFHTTPDNTASTVERMRISGAGNVGIGTATPVKLLDVAPAANAVASIGLRSTGGAGGKVYFGTSNQYDGSGANHAGVLAYNNVTTGGFEFRTNNGAGDPDNASAMTRLSISAPGRIGIGTTSGSTGSILDVQGTGTGFSSLIIPRDTTANRPTGINGMIRYNTNLAAFEVYANNNWATVATGAGGSSQWTTTGSDIYYNTGNVAIGTTAMSNNLTVVGMSGISQYATTLGQDIGGQVFLGGRFNGTAGAYRDFGAIFGAKENGTNGNDAGYFGIFTRPNGGSLTERMRVTSTGYVGIGTTTPTYALDARGTGNNVFRVQHSSKGDLFRVRDDAGGSGDSIIDLNADHVHLNQAVGDWNNILFYAKSTADSYNTMVLEGRSSQTADIFDIRRNGSTTGDILSVTAAGRIGLGSATPTSGSILDVRGTGTGFSSLIVPRDSTANRPTGVNGMIRYNTTSQKFEVYEGTWQNMISAGGGSSQWTTVAGNEIHYSTANVGIGTSDPQARLHVYGGNIRLEDSTYLVDGGNQELIGGASSGNVARIASGTFNNWSIGNSDTSQNGRIETSGSYGNLAMRFSTNGGERMRIHTNGNVGIGTNNPSQKLHVEGGKLLVRSNDSTFGQMQIANPAADEASITFIGSATATGTSPTSSAGNSHIFSIGTNLWGIGGEYFSIGSATNSNLLTIRNDGNVGIGTTDPTTKLMIRNIDTRTGLDYYATNDTNVEVAPSSATSAYAYYANFNRLYTSSSNLGTADFYGMDNSVHTYGGTGTIQNVWGSSSNFSSYAGRTTANAIGAQGYIFNDHASSVITNAMGVNAFITNTSGTISNAYGVYIGSIDGTNRFSLYAEDAGARSYFAGAVGIGTDGPNVKLDVYDSVASDVVAQVFNTNTGTSADVLQLRVNRATPATGNTFIDFANSAGTTVGSITGDGAGGVQYNLTSDRRLKGNIRDTHYSIEDLMKIRVRDYHYLGHGVDTNGFIAQELYEAYPHAVSKPEDESKQWWQVDYGRLTPLIVKGVQDTYGLCKMTEAQTEALAARVAAHDAEIEGLKREVQSLRQKNKELEQKLDKVLRHLNLAE